MSRYWKTLFFWSVLLSISTLVRADCAQWQVRRMRTCDAEKAGGYPLWTVTCDSSPRGTRVTITGDRGNARGVIYLGRKVRIPAKEAICLDMSYTTWCASETTSSYCRKNCREPDRSAKRKLIEDNVLEYGSALPALRLQSYGRFD